MKGNDYSDFCRDSQRQNFDSERGGAKGDGKLKGEGAGKGGVQNM